MRALTKEQRKQLAKVVLEARGKAEEGARKALQTLGVDEPEVPGNLSADGRLLRRALRAQARQLGDTVITGGGHEVGHLTEKIAYDQWHRMLFARFLAENDLLISPEHGVAVSLEDCRELATQFGLRDGWAVAAKFAAQMLPEIFRTDEPAGRIELANEDRTYLQRLVMGLPRDTFLAEDSLGWVYQFWQAKRKDEVNKSGMKIGADELPAVTQLFTEDYMVLFLLHNTLGAWWAGKMLPDEVAKSAESEDACRQAVALPGVEWTYLRFVRDEGSGAWRPAVGTFEDWPRTSKELRILDPCMGSGHFLVAELPMLVAMRMEEEGFSRSDAVTAVLRDNLFGLEIDLRCTQIAAFNLALAAWRLGGYQQLPKLNLACSGLGPNASRDTWLKLANGDQRRSWSMGRLYDLFKDAPILGSLIEPAKVPSTGFSVDFRELQPLLSKALANEEAKGDDDAHEMRVTAQGLARAADVLASHFTLVATNVPYLGRGKQDNALKEHCERRYPDAKSDLSTCFVQRCLDFCAPGGSVALVTPQNWLFLTTFTRLRRRLLREDQWGLATKLGPNAFRDMNWWRATTALVVLTSRMPEEDHRLSGLDLFKEKTPTDKESGIRICVVRSVSQQRQEENPDARILFSESESLPLLGNYASAFQGIATGDYSRFGRCFWELWKLGGGWAFQQSTSLETKAYTGREHSLLWEDGRGELAKSEQSRIQGLEAIAKHGVVVSQMNTLPVTLFTGEPFDNNCSALVVHDMAHWLAVWSFCQSSKFREAVREIDQAAKVTNSTLVKVPFDLGYWQKVAAEKYPDGLPKPHSEDPTQWLFDGHPRGSEHPFQVAVARLLGYRWPRQTGSSFPDCPALGPDSLESCADDDGIVCISAVRGEAAAADRLRAVLSTAFGVDWSGSMQAELLAKVGYAGKSLEDWLRNGFFEHHCQIFHQRPFTWHIWDGLKEGFSALVNYHKLDHANLEKLTYTYLGDWIARQKAAVEVGEEGSDARLQAARELQEKLRLILEGENPYDIFVRWKPLEQQPIGWEPDLNDGVRLNIRPFVTAGVLRKNPKINWHKDRGKDAPSAPWHNRYDRKRVPNYQPGDRINDYHLSLEEKRKAREKRHSHGG